LPIPESWSDASVASQTDDPASTLELYRRALAARRRSTALRTGSFAWRDSRDGSLAFERVAEDEHVVCIVNIATDGLDAPDGELVLASRPGVGQNLRPRTAAWVRLPR
jgi:alpha-glucosidase